MDVKKNRITNYQFILMIYGIQVGVGMLSLPRELAAKSGTSSWISIIFGGLITTFISIVYIKLREKSPNTNFLSFFTFYLGKFLGSAVLLLLSIYFIFAGYVVLIRSILYIQSYILQETSEYILVILFLVPTYQLITGGVHILAKYVEAIFPIAIFGQIMLLFTLKDTDINFILPIIKDGWLPIFKTIPTTATSFLGVELILIYYPYLKTKEKAIKGVVIANAMSTITYVFVTIICFVIYSPYEISRIFEPVIDILSVIEFQYVERLDFILFSLFLMIISKTWVNYIWAGMTGVAELFKIKRFTFFVLILFILFIISTFLFIPTFDNTTEELRIITVGGLIILIGLPILLWIGGIVKNSLNKVKIN